MTTKTETPVPVTGERHARVLSRFFGICESLDALARVPEGLRQAIGFSVAVQAIETTRQTCRAEMLVENLRAAAAAGIDVSTHRVEARFENDGTVTLVAIEGVEPEPAEGDGPAAPAPAKPNRAARRRAVATGAEASA
jgi:hypothetical protein